MVDSEVVVEVVEAVGVVAFVEGVVQGVAEVALLEVVAEVVASEAEGDHKTICNIINELENQNFEHIWILAFGYFWSICDLFLTAMA